MPCYKVKFCLDNNEVGEIAIGKMDGKKAEFYKQEKSKKLKK